MVLLIALTGWRLLNGNWSIGIEIVWWWLGAVIGFILVFADGMIYAFWQKPEDILAMRLKDIFGKGKWQKGLVGMLGEEDKSDESIMRSVLFLGVFLLMGLLAVTTVAAPFGRGFMVGLGMHLWMDLMADFLWKKRDIKLWFWQIKRVVEDGEVKGVVWGFTILFWLLVWNL